MSKTELLAEAKKLKISVKPDWTEEQISHEIKAVKAKAEAEAKAKAEAEAEAQAKAREKALAKANEDVQKLQAEVEALKKAQSEKIQATADKMAKADERLKTKGKELLKKATALNEDLEAMDEETRSALIDSLNEDGSGMGDLVIKHFPHFRSTRAGTTTIQRPLSEIIPELPMVIMEQRVGTILMEKYPLSEIATNHMVPKGSLEVFYGDYTDVDDKAGYDDVEIADFNQGSHPIFRKNWKVDTNVHKGYDIIDSILNDTFVSVGMFIAVVNDFSLSIARPIAKKLFQRLVTFIADETKYDVVKETKLANDTKGDWKEIFAFLKKLRTPSRKHLKVQLDGQTEGFEASVKLENGYLIIDTDFATSMSFDMTSVTYNKGELELKPISIIDLDFTAISEYVEHPTPAEKTKLQDSLKETKVLFFEKGKYNTLQQFSGTKVVNTPRLKSVLNRWDRIGQFGSPSKFAGKFKKSKV